MATGGFHSNPVASGQSPGPANARPASGYAHSPASPQLGNYPSTSMPGYMAPPPSQVPGSIPRYSAPPFQPGARPAMFTPRPPIVHPPTGPTPRGPMGGMRPLPPVLKPPGVMPGGHLGGPYEKPYTTVYVGKIASTVEDTFLRSILLLCGGIKSWKRAQDPTTGVPKGFGFCEFESAEGVLRALRLLNKHNLDGQELVLNVNKDTREYLERYVARKENEKLLEEVAQEEDSETAPGVEVQPPPKPSKDDSNTDGDDTKAFGIVSEVDKKGDEDALQRLKSLVEERAKSRPLFRPLLLDGRSPSAREASTKSKDDELNGKHDEETSSDKLEKMETGSGRRTERDRERDLEREKDRELERFERERERERVRREKERKDKLRESERLHEEHEREWEAREREKERQRLHDKEREKERERERKREIKEQEEDSDDDDWKKRRYRGSLQDERRRRRQREKEEDIIDAIKEEQEIVEVKKRKIEDSEKPVRMEIEISREPNTSPEQEITPTKAESPSSNGACEAVNNKDTQRESPRVDQEKEKPPPPKKLGFGLTGAGKRATLPSLFHQEEEEELPKDRKLRPLVPIDYSAEEMQAVAASKSKTSPSGFPPNIAAAAEFARSLSNLNEDDRKDSSRKHKERSRKDRERERERERDEQPEKPLDAKQLIDTIPKTKEELFSYPVDWAIYDKHKLHEKMRPWISKKIVEFLGEEETTFIDFIVNHTRKHVSAASMLQSLKSILDDEAEMFVLKMWRMLIFEIRRIETGLAKSHS